MMAGVGCPFNIIDSKQYYDIVLFPPHLLRYQKGRPYLSEEVTNIIGLEFLQVYYFAVHLSSMQRGMVRLSSSLVEI